MSEPITLKNKAGQLFDYDTEEDAQAAIQNLGYAPAAQEEITAYDAAKKEREEFGSTTDQALAALDLGAGAASFGILSSDSPEMKARRRQLRKQSPFIAGAAEIGGALAPALVTGGVGGVLAGGARAGRLASVGVDLAADFAGGLSLETEQAQEQGRGIDVGNVAMWTVGGVVAENVLRAGLQGIKGWKNNVLPGSKTRARDFRAGNIGDELTEAETRHYVENMDEITNQVRTLGHDAGNSFTQSMDDAHSIYYKPEDIRGRIENSAPAQRLQAKFADETIERAERLAEVLETRGSKKTAETIRRHIYEIESATDGADLFIGGDGLKRSVQKFRKKAAQAARQSGNDPFGDLVAEFDAVETPLRHDLEKGKVWGDEVASKQRTENAKWSGKDGFIHNNSIFTDAFYSRLPGSAGTSYDGLPQFAWDDSKLQSFLKMDRLGQKDVLEAGEKMLKRADEMTAIKEALGVRPDDLVQLKADVADLRTTLDEVKKLTQAKIKGKDLIAQLESRAGRSSELRANVATAGGATVGAAVAGPIGAAAGGALARQLNDFFAPATIRNLDPLVSRDVARAGLKDKLSNLGKMSQPTSSVIAGPAPRSTGLGASDVVREVGELSGIQQTQEINNEDLAELSEHGKAFTERAAARFASGGQRAAPLPDAPTRFQGSFKTLRDAFNARRQLLQEAASDPTALIDHLSNSYGDLPDTHPALFGQLAARVSAGVTYMMQNLPPSVGYSMRDPAGLPASQDAMRQFARLWDAVFEPAHVFHDVAAGRATPQQLNAVAAVHPDLFQQFQVAAIRKLSERLTPPPYETQRYLDQIMKLGGAYSPALAPSVARNIRNAMGSAPSNPQGLSSDKLETSIENPRGIASIAAGPSGSG